MKQGRKEGRKEGRKNQANRELEAAARTDVAKQRATDRRRRRESMVGRAIEKRRFAEIDAENEALARYVCVLVCVWFVSVCIGVRDICVCVRMCI